MGLIIPCNSLPAGLIALWKGTVATIPAGWALCDGTNGTPDLRDKFVVGAKQDSSGAAKTNVSGTLTQTGGAATASFSFSATTGGPSALETVAAAFDENTVSVGNEFHTHTVSGSTSSASILNPYYALAFIMKL